jgi:hypothetical protein
MFRSSIFLTSFFSVVIASSLSFAQSDSSGSSGTARVKKARSVELETAGVSYLSWTELVDLDNGVTTDKAFANLYGLSFNYKKEDFKGSRGSAIEYTFAIGQANAGGSQTQITYQTNYRSWYGGMASYRWAYRINPQITFGLGPNLLVRQVKWPSEGNESLQVKSGADFNIGLLSEVSYRLNPRLEIRQIFGTLAFKASTIWALGLGFKF